MNDGDEAIKMEGLWSKCSQYNLPTGAKQRPVW